MDKFYACTTFLYIPENYITLSVLTNETKSAIGNKISYHIGSSINIRSNDY